MFIHAVGIQKSYRNKTVVHNIDLDIRENDILAVIGPNGAGKSTMLEMLIGLRTADSGEINYWDRAFKEKMGVQLQAVPFFPNLSAFENLKLFAAFYKKKSSNDQITSALKMCGLNEVGKTDASKLSGGQQKRLAISIALIHDPELILLDEPTAALDPRARQEIHAIIKELHQSGKTVVFTSHDMDEVDKLATRVILINEGKIIAQGEPRQLCKEYNVTKLEELYLILTQEEVEYVANNF
ncbi:ABC transporter ATP-binding protein [Solibacillus sp. CAU 1738]|uniref:ABC transporter ATP-binding protein n=1 Tax=Solibacillus sp. CAU 1738 TaxID=3140363 RepID=UPI003261032D